ncbi:MAG: hypothetical protein QNJ94_09130 [Alphaproteobacteria bacterium]|nr:hypothetical protein [Alphaproteobacteria bacterium]
MNISQEDILMFARGFYGRRGAQAAHDAAEMADHYAKTGDDKGAQAWSRVAEAITKLVGTADPA